MTQPVQVPRSVRAAAARARSAGGARDRLRRVFDQSAVPMVLVDGERRYVEANLPARLAYRLSLEEMRSHAMDDLTPPAFSDIMEASWRTMLADGSVMGRRMAGPPACPIEIVFCAVADALPGLHAGAFAPATWPDGELDPFANGAVDPSVSLTAREIEVLTLAAHGRSGPEIAQELVVSPATVKTHFSNIHGKLAAPNRTAAVARALKLGLID